MSAIVPGKEAEPLFEFIAGQVCLDFANTIRGLRGNPGKGITSYSTLVSWSRQAGIIHEVEAKALLSLAEDAREQTDAILQRAYAFREATHSIFAAIVVGKEPAEMDLEALNREITLAMTGAIVKMLQDGFVWHWHTREDALDQMLGPLARSAATLLLSSERLLVRQCANEQCRWLFVDTTRNHRRQWCTTAGCGNYIRVQRHRQRKRQEVSL